MLLLIIDISQTVIIPPQQMYFASHILNILAPKVLGFALKGFKIGTERVNIFGN